MSNSTSISPDLRELELNALLEVTQAINNNLPEESLYKIYHFTLLAGLKVKKLALFVQSEQWELKVHFGIPDDFNQVISIQDYGDIDSIVKIDKKDEASRLFELAIPVRHKDRLLAVVFVGEMAHSELGSTTRSSTTFLEALTNIILVAIENKKLARQQLEQEAFRKELEIAKQVQQFLFPKSLPNTDQLHIDAVYRPHHDVGGDYYDYLKISDEKFLVCIADVSGKGVPAALMMSNFQASLHTLVRQTQDLELIVKELNFQLNDSGNAEIFITFFVAIYDYKTHKLDYVNCGHNPPIMLADSGKRQTLDKGTTVMGMFEPLPFFELGTMTDLNAFDLFCYTDGLSETMNANSDELGEASIIQTIESSRHQSPDKINRSLIERADAFRQGTPYRDDITLMSIKVRS
jgi:sigma-B regulation protein RsbU (phosphoserine phosphatase)